jgi:hypothetical protein
VFLLSIPGRCPRCPQKHMESTCTCVIVLGLLCLLFRDSVVLWCRAGQRGPLACTMTASPNSWMVLWFLNGDYLGPSEQGSSTSVCVGTTPSVRVCASHGLSLGLPDLESLSFVTFLLDSGLAPLTLVLSERVLQVSLGMPVVGPGSFAGGHSCIIFSCFSWHD